MANGTQDWSPDGTANQAPEKRDDSDDSATEKDGSPVLDGPTQQVEPAVGRVPGVPARAISEDAEGQDDARNEPTGKPRYGAKRHRGLWTALIAVLAVVLVVGAGVAYIWVDLNAKLNQVDVEEQLGTSRPPVVTPTASVKYPGDPYAGRAMNILVIGTDSREGANKTISGDYPGGVRSDTTFIAHVSADRQRVDIVSIPRDTWITIPKCLDEKGSVIEEAGWMHMGFNAAFAYGYDAGGIATGAACTIRAVEKLSNVRIDAYMVVDFQGFVEVVDAVGGLDVTLLCAVKSGAAGINLPKGVVHLDGKTAVGLARARKGTGLGDGSDLQRIRRQHALFNAIAAKVFALNYVTDFPKLYKLVGAVIGSVTTDVGSDLGEVAGFAYSLKDLDMREVTFITIPIADAGNQVNVVIVDALAAPVWTALREDKPLPANLVTKSAEPTESTAASGAPKPPSIQRASDCS